MSRKKNRYTQIIEKIFENGYREGAKEVVFERKDLIKTAEELNIPLPHPNKLLAETKIPDATPGIISQYALSDEQSLLAKLRYNRLIDIFSGVTCYSLQSHLRTTVSGETGNLKLEICDDHYRFDRIGFPV